MEELEDMKAMWIELNGRISALEEDNRKLARNVMNQNLRTAQEKLIRKYTTFIILSVIMIFYMVVFVWLNPEVVERYKVVTTVYWAIFFLFEASIDYYLRYRIKKIDIYNSSIREISVQAARNWKIHKIAVLIGIPLAFGAIILFGLLLNADKFIIIGMITGGLIGLLIGLRQLMRFRDTYRFFQSEE